MSDPEIYRPAAMRLALIAPPTRTGPGTVALTAPGVRVLAEAARDA